MVSSEVGSGPDECPSVFLISGGPPPERPATAIGFESGPLGLCGMPEIDEVPEAYEDSSVGLRIRLVSLLKNPLPDCVLAAAFAAAAAAEVDKLIETKGLTHLDRYRARKMAEEQAHILAEQRYSGGTGFEYAHAQSGPAYVLLDPVPWSHGS